MSGVKKQHSLPSGVLDPLTRLLGSLYQPYHGFQGYSWEGSAGTAALQTTQVRGTTGSQGEQKSFHYYWWDSSQHMASHWCTHLYFGSETLTFTSSIFTKLTKSEILQLVHRCTLTGNRFTCTSTLPTFSEEPKFESCFSSHPSLLVMRVFITAA